MGYNEFRQDIKIAVAARMSVGTVSSVSFHRKALSFPNSSTLIFQHAVFTEAHHALIRAGHDDSGLARYSHQ